jgi:H+/Cl- antiporter ClcA
MSIMVPVTIILGILGGLLGAFFININTRVNYLRKRFLKRKCSKIIETAIFCFFSASIIYWISLTLGKCEYGNKS